MHIQFLKFLVNPHNSNSLAFQPFEVVEDNIVSGILFDKTNSAAFPIIQGVPIILKDSFSDDFCTKFIKEIAAIKSEYPNLIIKSSNSDWSFSAEWETHFNNEMDTTWSMTTSSRYFQMLEETQNISIKDLKILDAGCGNGKLTEEFANNGALAFGVDLSDSVFFAEKNRTNNNVCYIKGNLRELPFEDVFFDTIVSNGVIHHTPNTEITFGKIAQKVKENGKFYIWLYSRKGNLKWRIKRRFFDISRSIISKFPQKIQDAFVRLYAFVFNIIGEKQDKNTLLINMYDSITPQWRFYHTPEEVAYWYFNCGFGPITLSHFDNRYGFGVVGTKNKCTITPGENYPN